VWSSGPGMRLFSSRGCSKDNVTVTRRPEWAASRVRIVRPNEHWRMPSRIRRAAPLLRDLWDREPRSVILAAVASG
jgi:hypothetical protein